jgi:hypothetical protein
MMPVTGPTMIPEINSGKMAAPQVSNSCYDGLPEELL